MWYREILAYVGTGDEAAGPASVAVAVAARFAARLRAVVIDADVVDYTELDRAVFDSEREQAIARLAERRRAGHAAARRAEEAVRAAAGACEVPHDVMLRHGTPEDVPDLVADLARVHDLVVVPAADMVAGHAAPIVEQVLFGSGRPLLLIPRDTTAEGRLDVVCIAWDGSRAATRAVHDALPLLRRARRVEIVSITDEKPLDRSPSGDDLVRHLAAHEIAARHHAVGLGGLPVGEQLMTEALRLEGDLMVMGAYGHARVRQLVFGGATRSVLAAPSLPVLMSY
ncbi:universal stress protein [Rhodoplanes sp. SY1]|uniref:universal stress protein n=1 Tax=Rhodoplanes sp. SY1 TaxID=3166646 RepID=UPI0038B59914